MSLLLTRSDFSNSDSLSESSSNKFASFIFSKSALIVFSLFRVKFYPPVSFTELKSFPDLEFN